MLVVALVLAPAARQAPVTLHFRPPLGKSYAYKMKMEMNMAVAGMRQGAAGAPGMTMSNDVTMKAVKRSGGVTTIESRVSAMKFGGPMAEMVKGSMPKSSPSSTQVQIDEHFHLVQMSSPAPSGSALAGAFSNISFPSHPLRVGESWTYSADMGKVMGAMGKNSMGVSGTLPFKCTLTAIEHIGGETVARVTMATKGTMPVKTAQFSMDLHLTGTGFSLIDVATGMFRKFEMRMSASASVQGQPFKEDITQSMTRM